MRSDSGSATLSLFDQCSTGGKGGETFCEDQTRDEPFFVSDGEEPTWRLMPSLAADEHP
jgi:hypothetical protein